MTRDPVPLYDLLRGLDVTVVSGADDVAVSDVVEDSRQVSPGALFVARVGAQTDGRRFIAEAVERGAVAVLTDLGPRLDGPATHLISEDVPRAAARLAERRWGEPSRKLALIGVTGTNGKTTVATLTAQLLTRAGLRCGLIGTVAIDDGRNVVKSSLTTPAAVDTSRLLARMVDAGCRACVMEASSHALEQGRVAGLHFAGANITNLSGDHLDYHKTVLAYTTAKQRLFRQLEEGAWAVLNEDDTASAAMRRECRAKIRTASLRTGRADARAEIRSCSVDGMRATFTGPWGRFEAALPLLGQYNVMNALQAALAAHALGLDAVQLTIGLAECRPPRGRLEPVCRPGEVSPDMPRVFVDYAHTDDALANALEALRPAVPEGGRLWVVFGCGGDRDRSKRPRMAQAAWHGSDEMIVTSDNPRNEEPERIIDDIVAGLDVSVRERVRRCADRAAAIEEAVRSAASRDVILVAGKGHEEEQIIGTTRRPFSDHAVAEAALRSRQAALATDDPKRREEAGGVL